MALGNISGKISRHIMGVTDSPPDFAAMLKKALSGNTINHELIDEISPDLLKAVQDGNVEKWLDDAKLNASDEKMALLSDPSFKQVIEFSSRVDKFATEFGDDLFNGKDIDIEGLAAKHGISPGRSVYKAAAGLIENRQAQIDTKCEELAEIFGGEKDSYITRATQNWVEEQKIQHEKVSKHQARASARTHTMDNAEIEKYIMSDIREGDNPNIDEFINNNLNLNNASIKLASDLFKEANERLIADAKIIAGPNGRYEDFMVLARNDMVEEDRIKNPGNYITSEAYKEPDVEFLTRTNDPDLFLNGIENTNIIKNLRSDPVYTKDIKTKPLNALEKADRVKEFAAIAANDLSINIDTALKSGDEAALKKLQNDIVILAKDYGNPQAEDFYSRPEFLNGLKDSSERIQFETELWDSIQYGRELDFPEMHSKYKDVDPDYLYKAQDFFDEANDEITTATNNGRNAASAREDWVSARKPINVLGEYEPPNTSEKDLPKFNPAWILNRHKIGMRLHPEIIDWKDRVYSSKAMLAKSIHVTRPVTKYVDEAMGDAGLTKALQKLNKDVLAVADGKSNISASDVIDNFAKDNREMLAQFRNQMRELREHVDSTFKTNSERSKTGDDRATNGDDLTIGQKQQLLKYVQDMEKLAEDIAMGIDGKNGQEILENLKLIRSGYFNIEEMKDSITGASRSARIANDAETRLTGFWPDQDHIEPSKRVRASGQYMTTLEQQIEKRIYDHTEFKGKPITYTWLKGSRRGEEGGDNLENTEQKFIEKYTKRNADGSSVFDWENDRAGETFLAEIKEIFKKRQGQHAVGAIELLARMTQTKGNQGKTIISSTNWTDAVNAMKAGNPDPFWHSETFNIYNKRISSLINRESSGAAGFQDTSFWTRGRLEYAFGDNRQARSRSARADYQATYATLHSNNGEWKLFGIPWLSTRDLSLPGGILATNLSRYTIYKPLAWSFGYDTYKPGTKTTTGIETKDFSSDAAHDNLVRSWRAIDADGNTTEGRIKASFRGITRWGSLGLFDRTTVGKGAYSEGIKEMAWSKPTTWSNPAGFKMTKFGVLAIGSSSLIGAGSEIYNGEYEGLTTGEFAFELGKNTAWGLGAGAASTMVSYDNEAGWMLGTILRLGVRATAAGLNVLTDGLGGIGEGVAHAAISGDLSEFLDTNREEDDGFNLSAWADKKWPSLRWDSHYSDDYKKALKIQQSSDGSGSSGKSSTLTRGGASDIAAAKEMSFDNLKAARDSSTNTDAAFNNLIVQLDTFANDRTAALDSNIAVSVAVGETDKVEAYEALKTQLDTTIDAFKGQIAADRLAVNKDAIEKLTEIDKLHNIVISTADTAHVSGPNAMLERQASIIKNLDSISDKSINLRMAEINAMTTSFDSAINSGAPIAASSISTPRDLVAEEKARADAEAKKAQDAADKIAADKIAAQEKAEKIAADKLAKEQIERIKDTPLGKAKIAAITALAAVKKEANSTANSVTKGEKLLKSMDGQASAIEKVKKEIAASSDTDKDTRIEALDKLLVGIKERRDIAADKLVSIKSAAETAKGVELSAVVLSEEIKNIPAIDNAANTAQATEKLEDLKAQIDMASAPANDAKSLIEEITQLGTLNISDLKGNQDFVDSFKTMTPEEQVQSGLLAMSGGSKNGIPYMIAGDRGNGMGSFIGGAWDTAAGTTKKFGNFWDDLERNTKTKGEQDALVLAKGTGMFFLAMIGINAANMIPGVNISKGWKWGILLVAAGVIFNKSGAWGDKMQNIREGKSPFAQGNGFVSGAATEASGKNVASHVPTGARPFGNIKIDSSNPNSQNISSLDINMQDATAQGHAGTGMPQELGSPAMSSDIEKAILASVTGKSTTSTGADDTVQMLRQGELDMINVPYSQMSANDPSHSIRVTA